MRSSKKKTVKLVSRRATLNQQTRTFDPETPREENEKGAFQIHFVWVSNFSVEDVAIFDGVSVHVYIYIYI